MPATAGSAYRPGSSDSSLCTASVPSGRRATTSVNVPPRSIQNSQRPSAIDGDRRVAHQPGSSRSGATSDRASAMSSSSLARRADHVHQHVQHRVPVLAQVQQALGGVPQLRRVAAPEPVGQRQVPVDVPGVGGVVAGLVVIGRHQHPALGGISRIQRAQVGPAVAAAQHREGEGPAGQRLQIGVGQQPGHQGRLQAEGGRVMVDAGEGAHRVEYGVQRLGDGLLAQARSGGQPTGSRRPARAAWRAARPG